jgi:hypothetical protein
MMFPENLADREKYIYDQVVAGNFEAEWAPLEFTQQGRTIKFNVMNDALKIDGVRVNVSAELQQKLADLFHASLLTAHIADLMFINAVHRVEPCPMTISSTVASMVKHSHVVDGKVGQNINGIVASPGKHWILDKKLDSSHAKACNYGWHFVGTAYKGIKGYPVASQQNKLNGSVISVIQPNACAHDMKHSDYSQICQLVSQACWIDGVTHRLSDVLQDPTKCDLATYGGPLRNIRQPGVTPVNGVVVLFPTVIKSDSSDGDIV